MLTKIISRPSATESGKFILYLRLHPTPKIDIRARIPGFVDAETFDYLSGALTDRKAHNFEQTHGMTAAGQKDDIGQACENIKRAQESVAAIPEDEITKDKVQAVLLAAYYKQQREDEAQRLADEAEKARLAEEARKDEEARKNHMTFTQFFQKFVDDLQEDKEKRDTARKAGKQPKGLRHPEISERTRILYKQTLTRLKEYEAKTSALEFDDITMDFFDAYKLHLSEFFGVNTIAKHFSQIKTLMRMAYEKGLTKNDIHANRKFSIKEIEVDNIYLTRDELAKIEAVNLTGLATGYDLARDIFLIGCWTAQRISDYNKGITRNDIIRVDGVEYIKFFQKKTGEEVTIPISSKLRAILEKRDYTIKHLSDPLVNKYIKKVAELAGITQEVDIIPGKGKKKGQRHVRKCDIITSHTARRTSASLMYLEGVDSRDIMSMTGHKSIAMLDKYIKSSKADNAAMLARKYDFFK